MSHSETLKVLRDWLSPCSNLQGVCSRGTVASYPVHSQAKMSVKQRVMRAHAKHLLSQTALSSFQDSLMGLYYAYSATNSEYVPKIC